MSYKLEGKFTSKAHRKYGDFVVLTGGSPGQYFVQHRVIGSQRFIQGYVWAETNSKQRVLVVFGYINEAHNTIEIKYYSAAKDRRTKTGYSNKLKQCWPSPGSKICFKIYFSEENQRKLKEARERAGR